MGQVGYSRPPKETQFTKGRSGNPKGRPKGSRNFATVLKGVLNQKVSITESGRRQIVTKLQAALLQLASKSMSGDLKAISLLAQLIGRVEEPGISTDGAQTPDLEKDQSVFNALMQDLAANYGPQTSTTREQENL